MLEACRGPSPRPLPWLWEAAARIAGEDPDAMGADAGVVARSLVLVAELFDLAGVCTSFDAEREAEAVGCSVTADGVAGVVDGPDDALAVDVAGIVDAGRVPVALDATERLASTLEVDVIAGLTGPATLTAQLLVEPVADAGVETVEETLFTATDACVELANAHLDRGADGVALLEPAGAGDVPGYGDVVSSVANVVGHYEAGSVVVAERADAETIASAGAAGLEFVTGGVEDPATAIATAADAGVTLGVGLPRATLAAGPEAVAEVTAGLPDGTLVSTAWTVPRTVAPETVHRLMGSM